MTLCLVPFKKKNMLISPATVSVCIEIGATAQPRLTMTCIVPQGTESIN